MRRLLRPVLGFAVIAALGGGCSSKPGAVGSDGGAQGGSAAGSAAGQAGKGGGAGSAGTTAGASSSGAGGKAGSGTGGAAGSGTGGTSTSGNGGQPTGGGGAAGGEDGGASGEGSGGTAAGAGGTGTAGAGGTSSCPTGQMWCPGCTIGSGTCAVGCPAAACAPCDLVDSLEECEARTDCHSVFEDPRVCGCAGVGCCAHFKRCADNERADCTGANLQCEAATPYCESPAYVVSYSGACYEGCVDPKDCAP